MRRLILSQLHRLATIRSSWLSILVFAVLATSFGILEPYWWALFVGIGTFGIAVLTVAQHYQHHTVTLLYLAHPKRLPVLVALVLTTVGTTLVFAALTGIPVLFQDGNAHAMYKRTLLVVPLMAVFGTAVAAIVRRSSWIFYGFALWFLLIEGLAGQLKWPLSISSYLEAARGVPLGRFFFTGWAVLTLAAATLTLFRDLNSD
jgi:hypothetical protein